jgi:hypothetical protein
MPGSGNFDALACRSGGKGPKKSEKTVISRFAEGMALAKKKRGQICRAVPAEFILSNYDWLRCLL